MLTVLDVSNHWSPTGGGVRRYQLAKIETLSRQADVRHVLVTPERGRETLCPHDNVTVERVPAVHAPGSGGYRYLLRSTPLVEVFARHRPDVVLCGSPIVMPALVRRALYRARVDAAVIGFWHADFPRTYFGRGLARFGHRPEAVAERLGWWWARREYRRFDATIVASRSVAENMRRHGIENLFVSPLGVDTETFDPARRDPELVAEVKAGDQRRRVIFFPHRLCSEKGLDVTLAAYAHLVERMDPAPALVFAGTGPGTKEVDAAVKRWPHVHALGYIDERETLARWFASSDITLSLSAWETFGLSTAEALASGLPVVAADVGAAAELVEDSGSGLTVPHRDPAAIARAVSEILQSPDLEQMRRRGRDHARSLTWEACFARELHIYRDVLRARRERRPAVDPLASGRPRAPA